MVPNEKQNVDGISVAYLRMLRLLRGRTRKDRIRNEDNRGNLG